jgi:primosomal protein N'
MNNYAEVAPALPLSPTGPQSYTYRLPAHASTPLAKYTIVTVPFGHRRVTGIVTRLHNQRPPFPVKTIIVSSSVTLTRQQVIFARWLTKTAHGGLGYTLRLFKPPSLTCRQPASYQSSTAKPPAHALLKSLSAGPVAIIDHRFKQRAALTQAIVTYYSRQRQVLTVVPEKKLLPGPGLTYQAGLRPSIVNAIWHGVQSGQVSAVRGTQKALFLPFKQLGLIIVEEEQNPAHKLWDQYPRLDNIDAVQALSRIHHCPVLYLSSFPSWRLSAQAASTPIKIFINRPQRLNTIAVSFSFTDKIKKYSLPNDLLLKLRAWSSAKKGTLLLYNRLDNKKIVATMRANLSARQLSYCQLSTSRIFSHGDQSFDRLVWLFPEQSITFPDYRSVENAHIMISRLQQLSKSTVSPIYLVTRQPSLIERVFQNPSLARTNDLKLRERLLLPPFASQVRLKISAAKNNLITRKSQEIYTTIQDRIKQLPSFQAASLLLRGPYALSSPPKDPKQQFIILRGPLDLLSDLYADLPIDSAELTPHRLI